MSLSTISKLLVPALCVLSLGVAVASPIMGPGARYATDLYPGFDRDDTVLKTDKKSPRWFQWLNGPKMSDAASQFAWAEELSGKGEWKRSVKAYDAIVRNWPSSPEAPKAQEKLADLLRERLFDYEEACNEYRYLLDFYSLECDYARIIGVFYETVHQMRRAGKRFMFCRFENTIDVRRQYEAVVLRASGAPFAPEAMLTIAGLRTDEEAYEQAVQNYESLRNLYGGSDEARRALHLEGAVRMKLLDRHAYNRQRCRDTIAFMRMALKSSPSPEERADFERWLAKAVAMIEDEAFAAARFYDSRTRTRASAISAYERFVAEYPASSHVAEAQERLEQLREEGK